MTIGIWKNADHKVESDWGVVEYTRARPERGEVGPLILVSATGYYELLDGPMPEGMAMATASFDLPRMFYHLDFEGQRWTWQLFGTHWMDLPSDNRVHPLYIGRWPD